MNRLSTQNGLLTSRWAFLGSRNGLNGRRTVRSCGLVLLLMSAALGTVQAAALDLATEYKQQHGELAKQIADRAWCDRVAGQVLSPASLIAASDRDPAEVVLRRTGVLLDHLRALAGCPDTADFQRQLDVLKKEAASIAVKEAAARYDLYVRACQLRRKVAFANPLLDFDRLLFLTKYRPNRGDHHMVDQYYGFNAQPGGSLYVLNSPWSEAPQATDLMATSTVENGRLQGKPLAGGAFNTLELDYDGQTVAFAYSECAPVPDDADWTTQPPRWSPQIPQYEKRSYYYWSPQRTFNLYTATLDANDQAVKLTNLRPLVDSPVNEFDPCYLPNGRIAFMSERRGGYLRCGGNRPNPNFTLHSMERDGADIVTLSYHETQEWNPSVDNDGMIVYTRWDYVDRDNDGSHHIWVCTPDGRDPRAYHGSYPKVRESRPWMELGIRAVPNSHRYVAVAAAHHGYAYGSLVLIDQSVEDDGAMSQLRRITPEAHFPEAEQAVGLPHEKGRHNPNGEVYGTPWPLSEEFYLCVYDTGKQNYGIYLIDAFGNKELVWRDPQVPCLDPIPLRSRQRPPVIPTQTTQHAADKSPNKSDEATVAIMNVYESDFEWPANTQIAALRVVQLYAKDTWHMHDPQIGVGRESLVRGLLGEVPVESDGSAYFSVPAGVPIYFQALDENGLAVQSMRSDTYLHAGERLTCVGCHEHKHRTPDTMESIPLAMRRSPSKLEVAFDDANPISFPRLIQPILDQNCIECHEQSPEKNPPNLSAEPSGKNGWSESYLSLSSRVWTLHGGNGIITENGMRSTPGQLGARVSKVWQMLEEGHHDVVLSPEDRKRLIVWLDLNSNFFGEYLPEAEKRNLAQKE